MARVFRAISSVYVPSVINRFIFGQGVVNLIYNATTAVENQQKTTSFSLKRGASLTAILFILTTGTVITPQWNRRSDSAFRGKIIIFSSVRSLT